jgi:hypothetical protein
MKKIFTIIACLFTLLSNAQQKLNKFHLVDSLSGKPVPSTSITIVRAKLSITTEKDGIFMIPGNLALMRDTVILNTQSYKQVKLPLYKLNGIDTIRLVRNIVTTTVGDLKYQNDTLLNDYKRQDVVHYAGINTETANFDYLQLAQQFYVHTPGIKLKNITLNRLAFGLELSTRTFTGLVRLDPTKFRIRIYDIDPITHGPGRDLCNKIIEESKRSGGQLTVNFKKYNIVIPNTVFFVAVEWLRDYYNAGFTMAFNTETKTISRQLNYRPAVGISAVTGENLNIWALNFKREWKPFTYFMPFGTDLAMSAAIEY